MFQSTHSLRSATLVGSWLNDDEGFQSTHSLRSATPRKPRQPRDPNVSIHALLAECDSFRQPVPVGSRSFNPRTPCGVRPSSYFVSSAIQRFQSTHSLRSATPGFHLGRRREGVSIHALLAECDFVVNTCATKTRSFNPRTPCGVRLLGFIMAGAGNGFNPRTPCGVRLKKNGISREELGFNPRTPCGVRRSEKGPCASPFEFQSTHSLRSATPVQRG